MATPGRQPQHTHFQALATGLPKRARTQASLLDSTVAMVAKHGVEAATVQAIVRQAGFAHGTFYNHFNDRDDVIRRGGDPPFSSRSTRRFCAARRRRRRASGASCLP